jgi:hypothetical protein
MQSRGCDEGNWEFTNNKNITFDGTRQQLTQLELLANLFIDAPEEHLHLQTPALTRHGSVQALETLLNLQTQWTRLQDELEESLYMDHLPTLEDIKHSIFTLREGETWYRIFQSRWRNAVCLHKSMRRTKHKMPTDARLKQQEKVAQLLELKERTKTDPTWMNFIDCPSPSDSVHLDRYVALAKWNQSVRTTMEDFRCPVIDLASFNSENARSCRLDFSVLKNELVSVRKALDFIDSELKRLDEFMLIRTVEDTVRIAKSFVNDLESQPIWIAQEVNGQATFPELITSCKAALEREDIKSNISVNKEVRPLLGGLYKGFETDASDALEALALGQSIDSINLFPEIKACLRRKDLIEICKKIKCTFDNVVEGLSSVSILEREVKKFGEFDLITWIGPHFKDDLLAFSEALYERLNNAIEDADQLIPWSQYIARRKEALNLRLADFVTLLESKDLSVNELQHAYAYCTYTTIVREVFRKIPQLGGFTGVKHNQIRDEFKRLDKEIIKLRGRVIAAKCASSAYPPRGRNGVKVSDKTEMSLLNLLHSQQRPRTPVRKMILRAQQAIQSLNPCFMMGPQAVAQYLTPGIFKFDLVIMDEASQLKPEEAIGAIARGNQLVVVGDSKQLPPTSFFRMGQSGDDDDQYTTTDAESILDVCAAQFQPSRTLRWHYRSQHHSLIAFSNHEFYLNDLVVFPSPYSQSGNLGIRATYLADAIYENQTNLREAKRVVDAVFDHIIQYPGDSLGVVTLNIKQRDLIAELIEERIVTTPGADIYRERWANEGQPLFIKNLENVQGDERDAIIISTTLVAHGLNLCSPEFRSYQ